MYDRIPVSNPRDRPTATTSTQTPIIIVGSIHQHSFPAEGLQVSYPSVGKLCWLNKGVEDSHPSSSSTMLEPRRFVQEMSTTSREYCFASSTSSCSFAVSDALFQFPINNVWPDSCLRVVFKPPSLRDAGTVVWQGGQ